MKHYEEQAMMCLYGELLVNAGCGLEMVGRCIEAKQAVYVLEGT